MSKLFVCAALVAAMIACCPSAEAQTEIQTQVYSAFYYLLDDAPPKHAAVGAAARIYLTSRLSLEPEIAYAKGFGRFNQASKRAILFNPYFAYDVNESSKARPYLIGGLGLTRYVHTAPPRGDVAEHLVNVTFGGGYRLFIGERFFVSPEIRVGIPATRVSVGLGYVARKGPQRPVSQPKADRGPRESIIEVAPGIAYAFGSGSENPGPSLWSPNVGAAIWFARRYGFAVTAVRGVGKDLFESVTVSPAEPIVTSNGSIDPREYLGRDGLRYYRVTFRYRRPITNRMDINIGTGLALGGRFTDIVYMRTPQGLVDVSSETGFGGLSAELLFSRRLATHLSLKSGVALDFNLETNVLLPVVQLVIDF